MIPVGLAAVQQAFTAWRQVYEPRFGSLHPDDLAEIDAALFSLAREVGELRYASRTELARRERTSAKEQQ